MRTLASFRVMSLTAAAVVAMVVPSHAQAQGSPTLHVATCAAGTGDIPLAYSPDSSVDVVALGASVGRGSIIDVGLPENDVFNFRFESDKPFTLYVWQRSPDGTSWDSPPTRRDAVAYTDPATGAAGFRYVSANPLRGESVYRFAMVPAPAFQNLPVTMRAAWRCGNTYPPGCGPMSGAGFTTASPLMEKDAVIATHVSGGSTRYCVAAAGSTSLYSCGLANRGGPGYDFQYTIELLGESPDPRPGEPPRRQYRLAWCDGRNPTEDATIEHIGFVTRASPLRDYDGWGQILPAASGRLWRLY